MIKKVAKFQTSFGSFENLKKSSFQNCRNGASGLLVAELVAQEKELEEEAVMVTHPVKIKTIHAK